MSGRVSGQPAWAGRVPRNRIEQLYRTEAAGRLDDERVDEVGYALLARCESILAITRGHGGAPICPGCLKRMKRAGETVSCAACAWSTAVEAICTRAVWSRSWSPSWRTSRRRGVRERRCC